jgi:hypothetical protein
MFVGPMMASPILLVISTVWPAFETFKASRTEDPAIMARWLQYWLVFAITLSAEWVISVLDTVAFGWFGYFHSFIPLYFEAKIFFFLWLVLDKYKGATYISHEFGTKKFDGDAAAKKVDAKVEELTTYAKSLGLKDARELVVNLQQVKMEDVTTMFKKADAAAAAATEQTNSQQPDEPELVASEVPVASGVPVVSGVAEDKKAK